MKLFALFDWDKTVRSNGYVMFDFIKLLVQNRIVDENIESEINGILKEHSDGNITYTDFAKRAIQICREIC